MSTASPKTIEQRLRSYSALVDFWDAEAGDTHEMLGNREVLHAKLPEFSSAQLGELRRIDNQLLALAARQQAGSGWDAAMLRKAAELVLVERGVQHAA